MKCEPENAELITHGDRFDICGSPATPERVLTKLFGAMIALGTAAWLWTLTDTSELGANCGFLALIMLLIGVVLPASRHKYLDFAKRQVTETKTYLGFQTRRKSTPFEAYASIVLRHVCHPGGEGPDTYTGSVGFKPAQKGAILWIKEYPTTADEMPTEPHAFAKQLEAITRIPCEHFSL